MVKNAEKVLDLHNNYLKWWGIHLNDWILYDYCEKYSLIYAFYERLITHIVNMLQISTVLAPEAHLVFSPTDGEVADGPGCLLLSAKVTL